MVTIEKLLAFEEGVRTTAYRCSEGFCTVGIGCNLDADPHLHILKRRVKVGDKITPEEVSKLFEHDLDLVNRQLKTWIVGYEALPWNYQLILQSMCFQLGIRGLLKWKNTLAAMHRNDPQGVAQGLRNSKFAQQTPNRAKRMIQLAFGEVPREYLS